MTYQHALRYLTASGTASQGNTRLPLRSFVNQTKATPPLFIRFTANKLGHTAALFLRNILTEAGISCLHWIDDTSEPKQRFWLDGKPISPPLMARVAGELHDVEIAASDVSFSATERCAAVLCRIAAQQSCRIILFESTHEAPSLPAFCSIYSRLNAIAVLSDKKDAISETVRANVRLVISPTYGPAFYRRISDACAASNIRLEIIKKSNRTNITPGAQTISYGKFPDCRLPSGSKLCADAAFLTMECLLALERMRFFVGGAALQSGLQKTDLSHACHLRCIQPLLLADCVTQNDELSLSLSDLNDLSPHLPRPQRLWLDDSLSDIPPQYAPLFDEIHRGETELYLCEEGTTLVIGPPSFIYTFSKNTHRKQKK